MAANYWTSSHCTKWIKKREDVLNSNPKDRAYLTDDELKKLRIYWASWISSIGLALKLRQRVTATASLYFKRFYLTKSFVEFEPALVGAACLQLAGKCEEHLVRAENILHALAHPDPRSHVSPTVPFRYEKWQLSLCEYFLLYELHETFVFHPDHELAQYLQDAGIDAECRDVAWRMLNDSQRTDVALLHHPHVIALGCVYLAAFWHEQRNTDEGERAGVAEWLANLNVDLTQVADVVQELLSLYEVWGKEFDDELAVLLRDKMPRIKAPLQEATVDNASTERRNK